MVLLCSEYGLGLLVLLCSEYGLGLFVLPCSLYGLLVLLCSKYGQGLLALPCSKYGRRLLALPCSKYGLGLLVLLCFSFGSVAPKLDLNFYKDVCPKANDIARKEVEMSIAKEPRIGASLVRLHFHDCFVQGCDGSVLLDAVDNTGEKSALPNKNSLRGFEVIDTIKAATNARCGNHVSCADILAMAARDSVHLLGGLAYEVPLGRRDALRGNLTLANSDLPSPFANFSILKEKFGVKGLTLRDLVTLSGAHTIGLARCKFFKGRLYNESDTDPSYVRSLTKICPKFGGDDNLAPIDGSNSTKFDTLYYKGLLKKRGLLHSDEELVRGNEESDEMVKSYANDPEIFLKEFSKSMVKMGLIKVLTGKEGEIRINCEMKNKA